MEAGRQVSRGWSEYQLDARYHGAGLSTSWHRAAREGQTENGEEGAVARIGR